MTLSDDVVGNSSLDVSLAQEKIDRKTLFLSRKISLFLLKFTTLQFSKVNPLI